MAKKVQRTDGLIIQALTQLSEETEGAHGLTSDFWISVRDKNKVTPVVYRGAWNTQYYYPSKLNVKKHTKRLERLGDLGDDRFIKSQAASNAFGKAVRFVAPYMDETSTEADVKGAIKLVVAEMNPNT